MRFLLAGLLCLIVGIGLTEYLRRAEPEDTEANSPTTEATKKPPRYPPAVATLLSLGPALIETETVGSELKDALQTPTQKPLSGFVTLTEGPFEVSDLQGGFGASFFVAHTAGQSGVVRVAPGESATVLWATSRHIQALRVDGSTIFFAQGGLVGSLPARGETPPTPKVRFSSAIVTSIASAADVLVVTLMPADVDPLSSEPVGAVASISSDGEVTLIASEQIRPRSAQLDGERAFWVAGYPSSLWRGALDGSFSSQLVKDAEEPLVLDGNELYYRAPLGTGTELRHLPRTGGKAQTLATADVRTLVASSGLVRFAASAPSAQLWEVSQGQEPSALLTAAGPIRHLAMAGSTIYVVSSLPGDRSAVMAK